MRSFVLGLVLALAPAALMDAAEIHKAVARGDLDKVKSLLASNPELLVARDTFNETPLHVATKLGRLSVMRFLLQEGADVNALDSYGATPLLLANDPCIVRLLLAYNADVEKQLFSRTALQRAASEVARGAKDAPKWRSICEELRNAGAYYDLLSAVYLNDLDRARALLKQDCRKEDESPDVCLHHASVHGLLEMSRLLLDFGADPNASVGFSVPTICDAVDHPRIVKALLEAGARVDKRVSWKGGHSGPTVVTNGATALHFAAMAGNVDSAKLLLDYGIDINARDIEGRTALHIAAMCGQAEMVRFLVGRGADPDCRDKHGKTPSDIARSVALDREGPLDAGRHQRKEGWQGKRRSKPARSSEGKEKGWGRKRWRRERISRFRGVGFSVFVPGVVPV